MSDNVRERRAVLYATLCYAIHSRVVTALQGHKAAATAVTVTVTEDRFPRQMARNHSSVIVLFFMSANSLITVMSVVAASRILKLEFIAESADSADSAGRKPARTSRNLDDCNKNRFRVSQWSR